MFRSALAQADLDAALREVSEGQGDIETILLDRYHLSKQELGAALSEFYQCPYLPYDERTAIDPDLVKALNLDYLRRNLWLPVARRGSTVDVVTTDPNDPDRGWDVRRSFPGATIRYAVGLRRDVEQFLAGVTGEHKPSPLCAILSELVQDVPVESPREVTAGIVDENDSAVVRLANHLISEADRVGASDIHIEPYADRKDTTVRLRVDGTCYRFTTVPAGYCRALVSRIKIMANLDIAERRKPQDGKIRFNVGKQRELELRVATLPTAGDNEDVVLRLLTAKQPMPLDAMDFAPETVRGLKQLVERPHGLILCVGPTGSGKTTTLHALLRHINTEERKIWTAEDPIEITQEGLRQLQVHQKIGLTFAAAMRSFLRADPDVIMIGEMRDKETADIAIEASLTGHLVLSTLHTNSAVETVVRLLDLGCDPFNFADAMLGVLAQRLCKKMCSHCKEAYHPEQAELEDMKKGYGTDNWESATLAHADDSHLLYRGRGCEACTYTGFKGRVSIHEFLQGSEDLKQLIQSEARSSALLDHAKREGMTTLLQDGIHKTLRGLTTYAQVRSVAMK